MKLSFYASSKLFRNLAEDFPQCLKHGKGVKWAFGWLLPFQPKTVFSLLGIWDLFSVYFIAKAHGYILLKLLRLPQLDLKLYCPEGKRNGLLGTELHGCSGETLTHQLGDTKTVRVNTADIVKVKGNNIHCSPTVHKTFTKGSHVCQA